RWRGRKRLSQRARSRWQGPATSRMDRRSGCASSWNPPRPCPAFPAERRSPKDSTSRWRRSADRSAPGPRRRRLPDTAAGVLTLNQLNSPAAIAFDATGRLYIADSDGSQLQNRVLVFLQPFTTGMSATRVMGAQPAAVAGAPAPTDPQIYAIAMWNPSAIFFLPG